jgi:hypothetical protein
MVSYCHDLELTVIDNTTCIKVSVNSVGIWRALIWDKSIYKYSVKIDTLERNNIQIGFSLSKMYDLHGRYYRSCGWYLWMVFISLLW